MELALSSQVRGMQNELKTVREFRKKRAEMQQQLEQLHVSLEDAERDHKTTTSQMEQQFFEEKVGTYAITNSVADKNN